MFIRPCYRRKNGKRHAYWALVESVRTASGPRQRIVSYLGQMDAAGRLGVHAAAEGGSVQRQLFEDVEPAWVEVDARRIRVERCREFGRCWLGIELLGKLGLTAFLEQLLPVGREQVSRSLMAAVLIVARMCDASSELHIAEHFFAQSALGDLLGIAAETVNDDRLYRTLDAILPH